MEGAASCKPVKNRDLVMPFELVVRDLNTKLSAVNTGGETLRFKAQLTLGVSSSAVSDANWT